MSESNNQQLGDGQDNLGQALKSSTEALRNSVSKSTIDTAKTGVKAGKSASDIATGTASAGPWGTIISAAWSMRHTLYRIIVFICLTILFFVVAVVSLPSIVFNKNNAENLYAACEELSADIYDCVASGYAQSLAEVEKIIEEGGYDYEFSMDALINYGHESPDYDVYYILAAYSASMEQKNTSVENMIQKLYDVAPEMFPVTYVEKQRQITTDDGNGNVKTETIFYVECTIHPFDVSVVLKAFEINLEAQYGQFGITYAQAIEHMTEALHNTLYGSVEGGDIPPLTDDELIKFLNSLNCSPARKELIKTGLSLVGRVPYFWGGKSGPGWNDEWNTPKLVTAAGSNTTGTLRPYGLDCSGFTDWVYKTALGQGLAAGSSNQWHASIAISESELQPGDLGFMAEPGSVSVNHVLIYAGKGNNGELLWVHCSSGTGVVLNSPSYVKYFRRVKEIDLDTFIPPQEQIGEPISTITVDVTHYCSCSKCCGINASGITASGKKVTSGMVAMSTEYPFGTQIMINGTLYTVEDRGSAIQGNRVDIYVATHDEALRLGRYQTEAQIYRLGR